MTTTEFHVTGMSCGRCEMSVREEVSKVVGVSDLAVSAQTGQLLVTSGAELSDAGVVAAVSEAGYSAVRV
ncbi:heavy-metal-associated domain-containing protein [Microbacterium profundi]|uniref:heavy-metal-associated domain-containing protein n=1 Tax=Microbacterium profundi TaxID=450380 RepID=UPI00051A6C91|nr:heavy-metal-associated domain-containing protein [Microbacterium profundi]